MTPFASRTLPLACAFVLFPALASAQQYTITITKIGSRTIDGSSLVIANAADCASSATTVEFSITVASGATGVTVPSQVDIWRGAESATCNDATTRAMPNQTACTPIDFVPVTAGTFTLPLSELTKVTSGTSACVSSTAASAGQRFKFFVLGATTEGDTSISMPYGQAVLTVDAATPAAPTIDDDNLHVVGGTADISWNAVSGSEMVSYVLYIDPNGTCANETPASSVLTPGAAPPSSGAREVNATGTSKTISLSDAGRDSPGVAVVAIATKDQSGNVGVLSALVCAEFVPTFGFCDEGTDCSEDCAVRAPGSARTHGWLLPGTLACVALLVHTRRRRRAK